jgi:hypothetical protein
LLELMFESYGIYGVYYEEDTLQKIKELLTNFRLVRKLIALTRRTSPQVSVLCSVHEHCFQFASS